MRYVRADRSNGEPSYASGQLTKMEPGVFLEGGKVSKYSKCILQKQAARHTIDVDAQLLLTFLCMLRGIEVSYVFIV